MSEKKPFNTRSFKEFANAIYQMHRTLVNIKRVFKTREDFEAAKREVVREYLDTLKIALEKAIRHGNDWLSYMKGESPQ